MSGTRPSLPSGQLDQAAVLGIFEHSGALRRGHFQLTSGRHSDTYLQCAMVLQWPEVAEALGAALAEPWRAGGQGRIDVVAAPAVGGILIGHEVARALGTRFVFAERATGELTLRRGLAAEAGERALVVEDVVTTGGSLLETARLVERAGARVAGLAAIVGRTPPGTTPPQGLRTLLALQAPAWAAEECPACAQGVELASPGSRRLGRPSG